MRIIVIRSYEGTYSALRIDDGSDKFIYYFGKVKDIADVLKKSFLPQFCRPIIFLFYSKRGE